MLKRGVGEIFLTRLEKKWSFLADTTYQLAQVIALEIENQIIEKSMRGHDAVDEESAIKYDRVPLLS